MFKELNLCSTVNCGLRDALLISVEADFVYIRQQTKAAGNLSVQLDKLSKGGLCGDNKNF